MKFTLNFDEDKNTIEIKLLYEVDEDIEELIVSGKLLQLKDNKMGIEWQK